MQIYDTVGCGVKKGSFYNAHLARIQEMYGLDKNILEVAGGMMPAFANKVAAKQAKTKKGTITVENAHLWEVRAAYLYNFDIKLDEYDDDLTYPDFINDIHKFI